MNQKINIAKLVDSMIATIPPYDYGMRDTIGLIDYIVNYRTVGLVLPRQCGKTTYINDRFVHSNSVLLSKHYSVNRLRKDLKTYAFKSGDQALDMCRGRRLDYKISYVLVDELSHFSREDIVKVLYSLYYMDALTEDLIVIKVGT